MSSKQKPQGSRTLQKVKKAIQESGLSNKDFFSKAGVAVVVLGMEVSFYEQYLRTGRAPDRHYEVPSEVVNLANKLLKDSEPSSRRRQKDRVPAFRPSPAWAA